MADVMEGPAKPEDKPPLKHLQTCPDCADADSDALWLSSATQITELQDRKSGKKPTNCMSSH